MGRVMSHFLEHFGGDPGGMAVVPTATSFMHLRSFRSLERSFSAAAVPAKDAFVRIGRPLKVVLFWVHLHYIDLWCVLEQTDAGSDPGQFGK